MPIELNWPENPVESLAKSLGDDAYAAFKGEREPWTIEPDVGFDNHNWYEWCDDCSTFHPMTYVYGYEVRRGAVELVVHCCDQDGNWDVAASGDVGTGDGEWCARTYGSFAADQNYREYIAHVARTGEDPCGEWCGRKSPDELRRVAQKYLDTVEPLPEPKSKL